MTQERPVIRETIVVEGKDDVSAVKRACSASMIITRGLGISREIMEQIRIAQERCGVIILTDPDAPGEKIRRIINQNISGCKQAYIYQDKSGAKGRIGVEYASPEEILAALRDAKATIADGQRAAFTLGDMVALGLSGGEGAEAKRAWLSRRLGLGHANGKQFLRRLNDYGISPEDLADAYREMTENDGEQ